MHSDENPTILQISGKISMKAVSCKSHFEFKLMVEQPLFEVLVVLNWVVACPGFVLIARIFLIEIFFIYLYIYILL